MRLDYVRSFIQVVNCKSFSLAAEQNFISQPTISMHIKQLELELGVQLLVRSTKDLLLSEAGMLFYPYALKLLETEAEALSQFKKIEKNIGGTVVIAASSVPCNYILPSFFGEMKKEFSDIKYKIIEGDSEKVIQSILRFESDFGIGSISCGNEKCVCQPVLKDKIVLAAPNTEKYRRMDGKFPLEALHKEDFIVRESGSGTRMAAEKIEKKLGLSIKPSNISLCVESSEMVRKGVEEGLGIAFISNLAIADALEQKTLLKFEFPYLNTTRQIYLLHHKERIMTGALMTSLKILKKHCMNIKI